MSYFLFLGSKKRKEHIERNLHSVDEDQTVLRWDELEVDSMDNRPHFPRTLASFEKIVLDLVADHSEGISVDQSQVSEENGHENWAPDDLIEGHFHDNVLGFGSFDLLVEPAVKIMSWWPVVYQTESRERNKAFHVEWSTCDEDLSLENT
jgi:hypothetical protein